MMKKLLALLVFLPTASFAYTTNQYKTDCYLETETKFLHDTCTVVETRDNNGALRTRNVFSNRFSLTVKSWFDPKLGFRTKDNYNNFEYSYPYKVGEINGVKGYSYIAPNFLVYDVPWD